MSLIRAASLFIVLVLLSVSVSVKEEDLLGLSDTPVRVVSPATLVIHLQNLWGLRRSSRRICAVKGSTVKMNCTMTPPEGINQEVNTQETFWSKYPKYDVDVKEDPQYSGRVQSTCVRNNCTLTITDVRETDWGMYRFQRNRSRYIERSVVYLTVTDLKVKVRRREETGLIFMCEDTCLDDRSVIWFKNGEEIKNETSPDYSSNQILHTDSYSCAVRGQEKFQTPPVYAPKLPSVSLSSHGEIKEGSSVNLTCSSDANPAARYTWYKVDGPLNPHHTSSGATLVFSSIQSSDFGEFYCEAENTLGRTTSKHVSVNLPWISDSVKTILRWTLLLLLLSLLLLLALWTRWMKSVNSTTEPDEPAEMIEFDVLSENVSADTAAQTEAAEEQEDMLERRGDEERGDEERGDEERGEL